MKTIQKTLVLSAFAAFIAINSRSQIVNGSFENGFDGWDINPGCFIIGTPDLQPIGSHGQVCADLGGGDIAGAVLSQTFPCNPNTDYELTYRSACNSEPVNDLRKVTQWQVQIVDQGAILATANLKQKNAGLLGGSFGFVTRSVRFHAGPNTLSATVRFIDTTPNGGQRIDTALDQVQVRPIRKANDFIINSSFERGFDGWDVNSGCFIIGIKPNLPIATDGFLSADLGGGDITGAVLSQTFNTTEAGNYRLDFDSVSVVPDQPYGLAVWDVAILVDGVETARKSYSQTNNGVVHGAVGFVHRSFNFTIPSNIQDVTVKFIDTTPGGGLGVDGGFDKVSVHRLSQ